MVVPFQDRRDAGRRLAARLQHYAGRSDVVVLGLARGGIPVAHEVAQALRVPLDVVVVRKLGVPGQEELAMGAIASGARVLNDELMSQWTIPEKDVLEVETRERRELERREQLYRLGQPPISLEKQTVILVDDGLATGSTMRAAALAARARGAKRVIAAVPVAAPGIAARLEPDVDASVLLMEPNPFWAVGIWFEDFRPTTDEEVRALLQQAKDQSAEYSPFRTAAEPLPERLRAIAKCLDACGRSLEHLAESVADAKVVMITDGSRGTYEFYDLRAEITEILIADHGFRAVAIDADWAAAARVNRFVLGRGDDRSAGEALGDYRHVSQWMWRNAVMRDFITWMHGFNAQLPAPARVGFHGLDLYNLHDSIAAVIEYLDQVDPRAAEQARTQLANAVDVACPSIGVGIETARAELTSRETELVELLIRRREDALAREAVDPNDCYFNELCASLTEGAGLFYRAAIQGAASKVCARHLADSLDALLQHLERQERPGGVVVWSHSAQAGDSAACGEWSLNHIARQRHGDQIRLVGMSTYAGHVTVTTGWDAPVERRPILPGPPESCEAVFHEVGEPAFLLMLRERCAAINDLCLPLSQRLADQFDIVIHLDETTALEPLDVPQTWEQAPPLQAIN